MGPSSNRDPAPRHTSRGAEIERVLLVLFRLSHDFLRGEIDPAGGEGIADEEVIRLVRKEVLAFLEVWILDDGERQLDRLRHDPAFKCGDGRLDRHRHLGRTRAGGRAFQAFAREFGAELAEAVLGFAPEGYEG